MAEHNRTVEYPPGTQAEGIDVEIAESIERPSEIRLADGSILRMKLSITDVTRLTDQWDPDGNPVYVVRSANTLTIVNAPPELKKQTT